MCHRVSVCRCRCLCVCVCVGVALLRRAVVRACLRVCAAACPTLRAVLCFPFSFSLHAAPCRSPLSTAAQVCVSVCLVSVSVAAGALLSLFTRLPLSQPGWAPLPCAAACVTVQVSTCACALVPLPRRTVHPPLLASAVPSGPATPPLHPAPSRRKRGRSAAAAVSAARLVPLLSFCVALCDGAGVPRALSVSPPPCLPPVFRALVYRSLMRACVMARG